MVSFPFCFACTRARLVVWKGRLPQCSKPFGIVCYGCFDIRFRGCSVIAAQEVRYQWSIELASPSNPNRPQMLLSASSDPSAVLFALATTGMIVDPTFYCLPIAMLCPILLVLLHRITTNFHLGRMQDEQNAMEMSIFLCLPLYTYLMEMKDSMCSILTCKVQRHYVCTVRRSFPAPQAKTLFEYSRSNQLQPNTKGKKNYTTHVQYTQFAVKLQK